MSLTQVLATSMAAGLASVCLSISSLVAPVPSNATVLYQSPSPQAEQTEKATAATTGFKLITTRGMSEPDNAIEASATHNPDFFIAGVRRR